MSTTLARPTTVTSPPPSPPSSMSRLRWAITDGWVMAGRNMARLVRDPGELGLYFMLPIMFVLVFGYVFGSGMQVPDEGAYREFLLPGVFVMTMIYGLGSTGTAIALDVERGVVDRFRAMPVARSALLVGRSLADLARALLEMSVVLICGLLVGWTWNGTLAEAAAAIGLILLLRFSLTWVGIWIGLVAKPDTVGLIVFPTVFPFTALSSIFVAPEFMPSVLGTIAEWNPLSATTSAARELFANPGLGGSTWAAENALLLAVLWPLALVAVFFPLAVRRYQRLSR